MVKARALKNPITVEGFWLLSEEETETCRLKAALPRFAHEKALTPSRYLFAKSYEYDLCLQARRWAELGLTKSGHGIRFCQVFLI